MMFFIAAVLPKREKLNYNQPMVCPVCKRYGRYDVYVDYSVFTFFFIPLFKFGRKYTLVTSCCRSAYKLDRETGQKIQRGEDVRIVDENTHLLYTGDAKESCPACGFELDQNFSFCPSCGKDLRG